MSEDTPLQLVKEQIASTATPPVAPSEWRIVRGPHERELAKLWRRAISRDLFEAGQVQPPDAADFPDVPSVVLEAARSAISDPLPFATPSRLSVDMESRPPLDPEARLAFARSVTKDILSGAVAVSMCFGPNAVDAMPLFVVRHASGKWRVCHDARPANDDLPASSTSYESIADLEYHHDARLMRSNSTFCRHTGSSRFTPSISPASVSA